VSDTVATMSKLSFRAGSTCQFKIHVERGCESLSQRAVRHKTAEKQCSWPPKISGITNYFERKRACPVQT